MIFALSSQEKLRADTPEDPPNIPVELQPQVEKPFQCFNRQEAENLSNASKENVDCHNQLKSCNGESTDWVVVALIGFGSFISGYALSQAIK